MNDFTICQVSKPPPKAPPGMGGNDVLIRDRINNISDKNHNKVKNEKLTEEFINNQKSVWEKIHD